MKLKYKVVLILLAASLVLGFGGYAVKLVYCVIAGWILFALCLSILIFSNKNETSLAKILIDGIFFSII